MLRQSRTSASHGIVTFASRCASCHRLCSLKSIMTLANQIFYSIELGLSSIISHPWARVKMVYEWNSKACMDCIIDTKYSSQPSSFRRIEISHSPLHDNVSAECCILSYQLKKLVESITLCRSLAV